MASLREIKDHIGSVRSTLKITSAMKLVSSAKLRKAQQAAEGIRPYTEALAQMLAYVMGAEGLSSPQAGLTAPPIASDGPLPLHPWADRASGEDSPSAPTVIPSTHTVIPSEAKGSCMRNGGFCIQTDEKEGSCMQNGYFCIPNETNRVAIVAVASNSSLCGAFNVNVVRRVLDEVAALRKEGAEMEVFSVGRKMAEAMRKAGLPSPADYTDLVGRNTFDKSAAFAQALIDAYNSGRYSRILFIYNHFVTTSSQKVTVETYLPFSAPSAGDESRAQNGGFYAREAEKQGGRAQNGPFYAPTSTVIPSEAKEPSFASYATERSKSGEAKESDFILEPSREEILATLLPQVMRLRVHTVLLDSIAAEHAARTIAMQTASDNAEDLLGELTLEYNKGRQQKITSEILDLVGGAQQ